MAEVKPTSKPAIPKQPGHRDPAEPPPASRPPPRRQPLPPGSRQPGKPLTPGSRQPGKPLTPGSRQPGKPLPRQRQRHRHPRRSCCCRICCWVTVTTLVAAALLAVAAGLAYLWFQPRLPSFQLESFNATELRVTNRPDGTFLDAATKVGILAWNHNGRIVLEYGDGEARVALADEDGDVDIGGASITGFEQGRRNRTVVRFAAVAKGVAVDEVAGARIRAGQRSKVVRFGVEVRTRVGLRVGGRSTAKVPIRVGCGPVSLKQGVSGSTLPKCRLYFLRCSFECDFNDLINKLLEECPSR